MGMRTSILFIVLLAAAALAGVGHMAFGGEAIDPSRSLLHAVVWAMPGEAGFAAPLLGGALILLALWVLRVVGAIVTAGAIALAMALAGVMVFEDAILEIVRALLS